jgi:hypothetical protein
MYILAILITGALDKHHLLDQIRNIFIRLVDKYFNLFNSYKIINQRQIRYLYLITIVPLILLMALIKISFYKYTLILEVINFILFVLSCQIFTWKYEAENNESDRDYINTYAVRFFAPMFWFLVIPTFGPICYLFISILSNKVKKKSTDMIVYNMTIDKMLFYANIIPFLVLYFFLAIAGNFEEIFHFVLSKRSELFSTKSFYLLERTLKEVVLISIGKDNFETNNSSDFNYDYSADEKLSPEITPYIVAMLYRTGLFFISVLAIIDLTIIMH